MKPATHRTALRVQGVLGPRFEVMEFDASTRSAAEAAAAIGCTVGQIAKSLVFRTTISDRPVLVITCGTNRVRESIIAAHLGETIERANADFVRNRTGFAIGGVPRSGTPNRSQSSSMRTCVASMRFGLLPGRRMRCSALTSTI